MRNFRDLNVWAKAHTMTLDVYRATAAFPKSELYGLTSQLRRACVSIEANLAEGCGRRSNNEFARFIRIAMGSATEVECHLMIARDLGYLSSDRDVALRAALDEVKRMLNGLLDRVESETSKARAASVSQ
jgi:four helix bundle protein